jgi:hypothetical protein
VTIHVFGNGVTEWFVAESASEAVEMALAMNREHGYPVPDSELDLDFVKLPDTQKLTIEGDYEPGVRIKQMTCREWADSHGKGFLATTEY